MTADGTEDYLVQPKGLPDYNIPPPSMIESDSVTSGMQNPEPNENVDIEPENESLLNDDDDDDDERKEFEDNIAERIFNHELGGKQVKGLYENGWFIGKIQYFNRRLDDFKVVFEDDTIDYISKKDIDDVELFLIN